MVREDVILNIWSCSMQVWFLVKYLLEVYVFTIIPLLWILKVHIYWNTLQSRNTIYTTMAATTNKPTNQMFGLNSYKAFDWIAMFVWQRYCIHSISPWHIMIVKNNIFHFSTDNYYPRWLIISCLLHLEEKHCL